MLFNQLKIGKLIRGFKYFVIIFLVARKFVTETVTTPTKLLVSFTCPHQVNCLIATKFLNLFILQLKFFTINFF